VLIVNNVPQLPKEKIMRRRIKKCLIAILLLTAISGCCRPALHRPIAFDGDYKGRVVDMHTGDPVEGVVITAVWYHTCPTLAGANHHFYDAYETLTDDNGNFIIPGRGIRLFINLDPAKVAIFKAGYEYYYMWWNKLDEIIIISRTFEWENRRLIIPLRKLTDEERLKGSMPAGPIIHSKYRRLFDQEINKVRIERGVRPFPIGDEK
jgi:hypothetical protein